MKKSKFVVAIGIFCILTLYGKIGFITDVNIPLKTLTTEKEMIVDGKTYKVNVFDYAKISREIFENNRENYDVIAKKDEIFKNFEDSLLKTEISAYKFDVWSFADCKNRKQFIEYNEDLKKKIIHNVIKCFGDFYEKTKREYFLQKIDLFSQLIDKKEKDNKKFKIQLKDSYYFLRNLGDNCIAIPVQEMSSDEKVDSVFYEGAETLINLQHEFGHMLINYILEQKLENYASILSKKIKIGNKILSKIYKPNRENDAVLDYMLYYENCMESFEVLGLCDVNSELFCNPFSEVSLLDNRKRVYGVFYETEDHMYSFVDAPNQEVMDEYFKLLGLETKYNPKEYTKGIAEISCLGDPLQNYINSQIITSMYDNMKKLAIEYSAANLEKDITKIRNFYKYLETLCDEVYKDLEQDYIKNYTINTDKANKWKDITIKTSIEKGIITEDDRDFIDAYWDDYFLHVIESKIYSYQPDDFFAKAIDKRIVRAIKYRVDLYDDIRFCYDDNCIFRILLIIWHYNSTNQLDECKAFLKSFVYCDVYDELFKVDMNFDNFLKTFNEIQQYMKEGADLKTNKEFCRCYKRFFELFVYPLSELCKTFLKFSDCEKI